MLGVQTKRRGDDDGVKVACFKQAPMIPVDGRLFAGDFPRRGETRLVNVTESGKADAGDPQEVTHQLLPTTTWANNAEADLVRWRNHARFADSSDATTDDR